MATNAREKCGGGIKQFNDKKKMVRLWKKEKTVLFYFLFFLKEVVLVLDNYREGKMWSWEKKLFYLFFNLAKN